MLALLTTTPAARYKSDFSSLPAMRTFWKQLSQCLVLPLLAATSQTGPVLNTRAPCKDTYYYKCRPYHCDNARFAFRLCKQTCFACDLEKIKHIEDALSGKVCDDAFPDCQRLAPSGFCQSSIGQISCRKMCRKCKP